MLEGMNRFPAGMELGVSYCYFPLEPLAGDPLVAPFSRAYSISRRPASASRNIWTSWKRLLLTRSRPSRPAEESLRAASGQRRAERPEPGLRKLAGKCPFVQQLEAHTAPPPSGEPVPSWQLRGGPGCTAVIPLCSGFSSPSRNILIHRTFSRRLRTGAEGLAGSLPARPAPPQVPAGGGSFQRESGQRPRRVLAKEDLSLMPTALSCFADALRSGADYVTSDAVFGYSGVTTLYHSPSFAACPGCALVSRELLRPLSGGSPRPRKIPSSC